MHSETLIFKLHTLLSIEWKHSLKSKPNDNLWHTEFRSKQWMECDSELIPWPFFPYFGDKIVRSKKARLFPGECSLDKLIINISGLEVEL